MNTQGPHDSDPDADRFAADGAANSSPSGRPPEPKAQVAASETPNPKGGRPSTVHKAADAVPP